PADDRQLDSRRRRHTLDEGPVDAYHPQQRPPGYEPEWPASVGDGGDRVRAVRRDDGGDAVAREAPGEQRRQVLVALRARRLAEQRGVDRDAPAGGGRDLGPAGLARVAGLDAEQVRERVEQVVPRVQPA